MNPSTGRKSFNQMEAIYAYFWNPYKTNEQELFHKKQANKTYNICFYQTQYLRWLFGYQQK